MNQDAEQLELLSIFHFVLGGITALFSLFPIFHVAIGVAIVSGVFDASANGNGFPRMFGWFFIALGGAIIALGMTMAALLVAAGRALRGRRHHTFCVVVAGFSCLMMPLGTVLGVFTIIVLLRESVKTMFDARAA